MTLGIIIQARTGSKRFPRKVLAELAGAPVIQHVIDRCLQVQLPAKVILAVPFEDVGVFTPFGVPIVYGPNDDVLERYFIAAKDYSLDTIIRITGDCPLIPPELIECLIGEYMAGGYAAGCVDWPRGGYPKGYGCEIFNWFTLNLARTMASLPEDREHVTPWIYGYCRSFYLKNPDGDLSDRNYCVDYPEDIQRLEKILKKKNKS